jgi:hypothetical protein
VCTHIRSVEIAQSENEKKSEKKNYFCKRHRKRSKAHNTIKRSAIDKQRKKATTKCKNVNEHNEHREEREKKEFNREYSCFIGDDDEIGVIQ